MLVMLETRKCCKVIQGGIVEYIEIAALVGLVLKIPVQSHTQVSHIPVDAFNRHHLSFDYILSAVCQQK